MHDEDDEKPPPLTAGVLPLWHDCAKILKEAGLNYEGRTKRKTFGKVSSDISSLQNKLLPVREAVARDYHSLSVFIHQILVNHSFYDCDLVLGHN